MLKICEDVSVFILWFKRPLSSAESINRFLTRPSEQIKLVNGPEDSSEGNPCTKFGIDQVKGSKDIERTTLGLQTDRPTDRPTDIPTDRKLQNNMPPFSRGA